MWAVKYVGMMMLVRVAQIGMGFQLYEHHVIVSDTPSEPGCKLHGWVYRYHCGTLESLFELLKDKSESVDVFIEPGSYDFLSSYSLENLHYIRIRSSDQDIMATISCKHNHDNSADIGTGIKFIHSSDLIIEYVNIRWCGMKHISTGQVNLGILHFIYFRIVLYTLSIVQALQ